MPLRCATAGTRYSRAPTRQDGAKHSNLKFSPLRAYLAADLDACLPAMKRSQKVLTTHGLNI
jgi:hypothetical protein